MRLPSCLPPLVLGLLPAMQSVRTTGLCRVLVIPRALYHALTADFPSSTRAVLDNLLARAEQVRFPCSCDVSRKRSGLLGQPSVPGLLCRF
jgi:hypothetical protein